MEETRGSLLDVVACGLLAACYIHSIATHSYSDRRAEQVCLEVKANYVLLLFSSTPDALCT